MKLPKPAVHGLHAFTETQMREFRNAALEEAAKVCDKYKWGPPPALIKEAIRNLKEVQS